MSDHDPMCPQHGQTMRSIIAFDTPCRCEFIDRVRAEERRRWGLGWVAAADNVVALAHAEAVAARLVGVIVQMDAEIDYERFHKMGNWRAFRETLLERDAARAEVETWKRIAQVTQNDLDESASTAVRWYDDLQEARAEVAALVRDRAIAYQERDAARVERQEALAKVAALDDHLATLKRLDDADTAEINRLKETVALRAEVAALTRWKDEATAVIEAWERVHALLGKPGFIGESKAEATWVEVRDLLDARNEAYRDRDAARAEVAALRKEVAHAWAVANGEARR